MDYRVRMSVPKLIVKESSQSGCTVPKAITLAQIGCGYWGPNLLRSFTANPNCKVKWVSETSTERQNWVKEHFPEIKICSDWSDALLDPEVDGLIIATPAASHFPIARKTLVAGKHAFVEKPLALSSIEAHELIGLADQRRLTLMAGHTFLYNHAITFLKDYLVSGKLGQTYYLYSQRLNLGQLRTDVNAWWNLAPHDISIFLHLLGNKLPESISVVGTDYVQQGVEDVAFAILTWDDGVMGHIHVSWLDPEKVRKITVVGKDKMIVYNEMVNDKLKVFDKGIEKIPVSGNSMDFDKDNRLQFYHRSGDLYVPNIEIEEPLQVEARHFLDCISTNKMPLSGGEHAEKVVRILEAGQESLLKKQQIYLTREPPRQRSVNYRSYSAA